MTTGTSTGTPTGGRGRPGRRPGSPQTRKMIVDVAERVFVEHGPQNTTAAAIADESGVDPAMINYFFGSKHGLFREVMQRLMDPAERRDAISSATGADTDEPPAPEDFARRILQEALRIWEDDPRIRRMLVRLTVEAGEDRASAKLLLSLEGAMTDVVEKSLVSQGMNEGEARRRAAMIVAINVGLTYGRYVVQTPKLTDLTVEEVVDGCAPAVRALLEP